MATPIRKLGTHAGLGMLASTLAIINALSTQTAFAQTESSINTISLSEKMLADDMNEGDITIEDLSVNSGYLEISTSDGIIIEEMTIPEYEDESDTPELEDVLEIEEVIVTGTRTSLQNAQEIKRNANTFVDAISADDINALPDRSVLESLQRLPGVSVERFASSDDPDRFSAEGSGAVVRGMTATRTEFNGRDSFTANSGRGLSFQDVPPELMASVKLYKNQSADLIEGGIGGTVSLHTRKPFDSEDRISAISADYTYFDLSEEVSPNISGLYSNRWDTDKGEFGFLIGLARGESSTRSDGIQSEVFNTRSDFENGFDANGQAIIPDLAIYPSGANIGIKHDQRVRRGTSIALQWRNPEETLETTAAFMRSDSTLAWTERKINVGTWDTNRGDHTRPMAGTQFDFDSTGTFNTGIIAHGNEEWRTGQYSSLYNDGQYLDALRLPRGADTKGVDKTSLCFDNDPANNIYVIDPATDETTTTVDTAAMNERLTSEGLFCNERSPTFGQRMGATSRIQDQRTIVDDYSFNFKFTPNEKWELEADFQYIDAQTSNTDVTLGLGTYALVLSSVANDVPTMAIINPWETVSASTKDNLEALDQSIVSSQADTIANGGSVYSPYTAIDRSDSAYFRNKSSYYWDFAQDHYERSEGEEFAARFDATHFIDGGIFESVKMGVRFSKREQIVRADSYNWGSLDQPRAKASSDPANTDVHHAGWADMVGGDLVESYDWGDFYRGDSTFAGIAVNNNSSIAITNDFIVLAPKLSLVEQYRDWDTLLSPFVDQEGARPWVPASSRDKKKGASLGPDGKLLDNGSADGIVDTQGYFLPEDISDVTEENQSIYIRLDFRSDDYKFAFNGNVGLRYFHVGLNSSGYSVFPDLIPTESDPKNAVAYNRDYRNFLPDEQKAFANNGSYLTKASNGYAHFLPSFNLKVEFTDELLGRFAISKAVSLPDIGDLRSYIIIHEVSHSEEKADDDRPAEVRENDTLFQLPFVSANVDVWGARAGNPYLEPMQSIQYDAALEWYFADVGSLTGSIFFKELSNFFIDGAFASKITNPETGASQLVNVQSKTNSDSDGSLQGFEIAYQQQFDMLPSPFDGFGTQINYTLIDVSGVPNPALTLDIEDPDAVDYRSESQASSLPLQSQSKHTANFTLWYEKGPVSIRTAYNWRSRYLVTARDASNYPFPATWAAASGYLDASAFYNITDKIKVGVQGTNLLNTIAKTEYQDLNTGDTHGRSWFVNDRRYSLVLRANF